MLCSRASQSLTLDIKPILKSRSFEVPTPPKTSPCKCRRRMTITGLEEARLMKFKAAALKAHFADSYIGEQYVTITLFKTFVIDKCCLHAFSYSDFNKLK